MNLICLLEYRDEDSNQIKRGSAKLQLSAHKNLVNVPETSLHTHSDVECITTGL